MWREIVADVTTFPTMSHLVVVKQNARFVAANPATIVGVGTLDHRAMLMLAAPVVSISLARRDSPFAYLAGIVLVTVIARAQATSPQPSSCIAYVESISGIAWTGTRD
jgi:xanthine/uracil/vitamin C permease (AzgA family)